MSTPGADEETERAAWWPTTIKVASLVRARTRVRGEREQRELGRFANPGDPQAAGGTRPTADEAEELVAAAAGELTTQTGGIQPCSDGLRAAAGSFLLYRAAQLVELSYYPESTSTDSSAAQQYGKLADGLISRLAIKIPDTCAPEVPDDGAGRTRQGAVGVLPVRGRTGFRDPRAW